MKSFEDLTPAQVREMRLGYLDYLRAWLPQLSGKKLEEQQKLIAFVERNLDAPYELNMDDAFDENTHE